MALHQRQNCRWRRRKEARPGEIIEAALDLFAERGFIATRLDDVARRAGVSKGTVYLYFKSKEDLFRAMVQDVILPQVEHVEGLVAHHQGTQRELIERFAAQWWLVVGKTRLSAIPKLLVSESAHFPELATFYVEKVISRVRKMLAGIIEKGIQKGEFRDCDVLVTARLFLAPLVFFTIWQRSLEPYDKEQLDPEILIQAHVQQFLKGIANEA